MNNTIIEYKNNIDYSELARELEEKAAVNIEYDCTVYCVWWSDLEHLYCYEVFQGEINFSNYGEYEEEGENLYGGKCNGTALEAIIMMLEN